MRRSFLTAAVVLLVGLLAAAVIRSGDSKPVSGRVVFREDYETGAASQWTWGVQCSNFGQRDDGLNVYGDLTLERRTVGHGTWAGRIDLPAAAKNTRCEGLRRRPFGFDSDDWYGQMFMLPAGWREPSASGWGLAISQFNYERIWGPPVGVFLHAHKADIVLQSGFCADVNTPRPRCRWSSGPEGNVREQVAIPKLQTGVWYELITHVHWASDSSGLVEAWYRAKGRSQWTKTVSLSGHPTVQWSKAVPLASLHYGAWHSSDKYGGYRGAASHALTIWHDGIVNGDSFSAVSRSLP